MMDSWHLFKIFHSRYISYFVFAFYTSVRAHTPMVGICPSPWSTDQPPMLAVDHLLLSRGPSKERLQSTLGAQRLGVQKPKNHWALLLVPFLGGFALEDPCESKQMDHMENYEGVCLTEFEQELLGIPIHPIISACLRKWSLANLRAFFVALEPPVCSKTPRVGKLWQSTFSTFMNVDRGP